MGAQEAALRLDLVRVQADVAAAVHEHSAAAQDIARLGCSAVVAGDCERKIVRHEDYREPPPGSPAYPKSTPRVPPESPQSPPSRRWLLGKSATEWLLCAIAKTAAERTPAQHSVALLFVEEYKASRAIRARAEPSQA